MIVRIRAGFRLLLAVAVSVLTFLMATGGRVLLFWRPAAAARWRRYWFRRWGRNMLRVLGADVEIVGAPPRPPFFLVSNHLSYVDIMVLSSQMDAVFVAKSEIRGWPLIGLMCHHMGTIFIDRNARRDIPRAVGHIERALEAGEGVVLFPEGTSTAGGSIAPFRPSLLAPAARGDLPVSTAALSYSTPSGSAPAHLAVCWWGEDAFVDHFLRLLLLPGFSARVAFGSEPIRENDRKQLAVRLEDDVRELFVPVAGAGAG